MSKTLKEYFSASWRFLTTIFIITVMIVFLRLFSEFPSRIQSLLTLGGVAFIGLAGWSVVRMRGFNLKQAAFMGLLLSLGTHWSVPIFHRTWEVTYLILINSILFSMVTVFGGWLAKQFKKKA